MAPFVNMDNAEQTIKFTCVEIEDLALQVYWTISEAGANMKSMSVVGGMSEI